MLRENVGTWCDPLTHEHKDHIAGMDDVRAYNYKAVMQLIFCRGKGQKTVKKEYSYVFAEYQYPGIPMMRLNPVPEYGFQ